MLRCVKICRTCSEEFDTYKSVRYVNCPDCRATAGGYTRYRECPGCGNQMRGKMVCRSCQRGENHPAWRGGRRVRHGYVLMNVDGKYVLEHRVIMAQVLGRPLTQDENVHHINGDRADNRPENLELWNTSQPGGQRPSDKVAFAVEILRQYAPHLLSDEVDA